MGVAALFAVRALAARRNSIDRGDLRVVSGVPFGPFRVGSFVVSLTADDEPSGFVLRVTHVSSPDRVLWESIPGRNFVSAARGQETVRDRRSHYSISDRILERYPDQTIESVEENEGSLRISGRLAGRKGAGQVGYQLTFSPASDGRLRFEAEADGTCNRVYLTYASSTRERFFGFGEQFTYLDPKGRKLPIFVGEQGVGRGAQPATLLANLRAGTGGCWHTTYAGVPHYITSGLRSLFLENYEYSAFDLRKKDEVRAEVFSSEMAGQIVHGRSPEELIEAYTEYAGRMRPLPDWVLGGAVVGLQGGLEKVRRTYEELVASGVPLAALWLQDWVGQRQTSFGSQLWWNWELDEEHHLVWDVFGRDLLAGNVRLMTYINPFVVDVSGKKSYRRSLIEEAAREGYLVRDSRGEPYMIPITDFSAALVDLTNPAAREWLKQLIKEMISGGVSGWMADFGEGLPYDAVLHSEESPKTYHNRYPEEWAKVNREAVEEAGREGDVVFFHRSGYTRSPRYAALFWAGDQLVSWDRHDGLKSAITGLLSSGFSGYSLNHSDTGGYTAIEFPPLSYRRSRELLMRWSELSAFTVVMRTHEGNRPETGYQVYSDQETLSHFSRMARVYKAWEPYRKELVVEAAEKGLPVIRHPFIHYPEDREVWDLLYQFMVGREFVVAPVVEPGARQVQAYLPEGRWTHVWSGRPYGSVGGKGAWVEVEAPLGEPAVFYREGSAAGLAFRRELGRMGLLG